MKKLSCLFLVFFSTVVCAEMKILFIDELTLRDGKTPTWGQDALDGFQMALKETKSSASIEAVNVFRSPVLGQSAVQERIGKVDLIVGLRTAGQALMVHSLTQQHNIPFVAVMATADELLEPAGFSYMMAARNSYQIKALVDDMWEKNNRSTKKKKDLVGIVSMKNCVYCEQMSDLLQKELQKINVPFQIIGEVLFQEPLPSEMFENVEDLSHVALFIDEVGGMAALSVLEKKQYKGVIFGGDSWSVNYFPEQDRSKFEDLCLKNAVTHVRSSLRQDFFTRYAENYGKEANDLSVLGYDTGIMLAQVKEKCLKGESLFKCLQREIPRVDMPGVSGRINFEKDGGRTRDSMYIKKFGCKVKHAEKA